MKYKKVEVAKLFEGVEQSRSLLEKEQEIERLRAEIASLAGGKAESDKIRELEATISGLRDLLKDSSIVNLPVDSVRPNPDQPRKTFSGEDFESFVLSLKKDGQQVPIMVFQDGDNYVIFDGERRWRGYKALNKETISAVIVPEPEDLQRQVLLANIHRENLNGLDLAEALIAEIVRETGMEATNVPKILKTAVRRLERNKRLSELGNLIGRPVSEWEETLSAWELDGSEREIFSFLMSLQLHPASVSNNVFPTLKLYPDLKLALRQKGLSAIHANIIQQLSAEKFNGNRERAREIREKLVEDIIALKLSVRDTRSRVRELLTSPEGFNSRPVPKQERFKSALDSIELESLDVMELAELKKILRQKLKAVEERLKKP